ncbi:MAG: hypothetical protein LKJ76_03885 [Lachnospiraceae bacterium]|nr:hypothetical protein [Lachnospiraceae bacterium]
MKLMTHSLEKDNKMGKMMCGAAKRCITPDGSLLPKLYGLMWFTFGGVMDDIYTRVIALGDGTEKSLLISFDLDKAPMPELWIPDLSETYNIPEENILYIGIHTHSAPVVGNRPLNPKEDKSTKSVEVQNACLAYESFIYTQLKEAVKEALNSMRPAKMRWAFDESYVNTNRNQDYYLKHKLNNSSIRNALGTSPASPCDHTLFAMQIDDEKGVPVAFFINHPTHNIVTIGNRCGKDSKVAITGDMGGRCSGYLEKEFDGAVAIWSSGAAGDLNAAMSVQIYYPDPETGDVSEVYLTDPESPRVLLDMMSGRHFEDIRRALRNLNEGTDTITIHGKIAWSETPARNVFGHMPGPFQYEYGDNIPPYRIRLHLISLGDVSLFGIGGELYQSLGKAIKEASPCKNTIVINHDASLIDDAGYIHDDATLKHAAEVNGGALGTAQTRSLPGYVKDSLIMHVRKMFAEA